MKTIACIWLVCVSLLIGFQLGCSMQDEKEIVRYEKGETIEKYIEIPVPYAVKIPDKPLFFYKTDTVYEEIVQVVDTSGIIEDWIAERKYNIPLFDDESGKMDVSVDIQYNRLQDLTYRFTPIHKTTTVYREKRWQPFVSASWSSYHQPAIGGGIFYKQLGVEYLFQWDTDRQTTGYSLGLKYRF